jgi:hypothetical protein
LEKLDEIISESLISIGAPSVVRANDVNENNRRRRNFIN